MFNKHYLDVGGYLSIDLLSSQVQFVDKEPM